MSLESDTVSGTIKEAPSYTQIEVKLQDLGPVFKHIYIYIFIFLTSFNLIIETVLEQIRALVYWPPKYLYGMIAASNPSSH